MCTTIHLHVHDHIGTWVLKMMTSHGDYWGIQGVSDISKMPRVFGSVVTFCCCVTCFRRIEIWGTSSIVWWSQLASRLQPSLKNSDITILSCPAVKNVQTRDHQPPAAKRPRGRPRKEKVISALSIGAISVNKACGFAVSAAPLPSSQDPVLLKAPPPKRKRGRPRKEVDDVFTAPMLYPCLVLVLFMFVRSST